MHQLMQFIPLCPFLIALFVLLDVCFGFFYPRIIFFKSTYFQLEQQTFLCDARMQITFLFNQITTTT